MALSVPAGERSSGRFRGKVMVRGYKEFESFRQGGLARRSQFNEQLYSNGKCDAFCSIVRNNNVIIVRKRKKQ
jgi:hypothetical protein